MLFRRVRAEFSDGVIDLLPLRLYPPEKEMGFGRVYDYMIVPHGDAPGSWTHLPADGGKPLCVLFRAYWLSC